MPMPRTFMPRLLLAAAAVASATPASAVPAFARKHGTSCLTCHTVFPKLTPFGEAFRRNNYRFPGVDSDYVKQETVALGQEANKKTFPNSVWPGTLPASVPIAVGFLGAANVYPDKTATIPRQNNGTRFSLDDLVAEGQIFVAGSVSDQVTVWAEVSIADGGADVEHASVIFSDLLGPKHWLNLAVGKASPTLSSFGPHSSYAGGLAIPDAPVTAIYADAAGTPLSADPFVLSGNYKGVELNGVVEGRLNYALGLSTGTNSYGGRFNSENWYATAGYKVGGMRLDGEGETGPKDSMRPWAEDAFTLHAFLYHSNEWFPDPADNAVAANNVSFTAGGGLRAQYGSAELDLGYYSQSHNRGLVDPASGNLGKVTAGVLYGELSYVAYPWLVPFVRVQQISLRPSGGSSVSDLHVMPGVAFLVRPNIRLVVAGNIESANGFPQDGAGGLLPWQGGSGDTGALVIAPRDPAAAANSKQQEFSSLTLVLAWAL
jgi:uncharacterized protein YciI